MPPFKKIAQAAGAVVATAVAAYAIKRIIGRLLAGRATPPPPSEELAEETRMSRMSRKERKRYRAARRVAEA